MKVGPQKALLDLYAQRLKMPFEVREFEAKASLPLAKRQDEEAQLLLSPFTDHAFLIALDERGTEMTSAAFADLMQRIQTDGYKALGFLIGGADGHHPMVHKRADVLISFGRMTWPHMLVRALVAEQLYRAESILAGHPYHRE